MKVIFRKLHVSEFQFIINIMAVNSKSFEIYLKHSVLNNYLL